MKLKYLFFAVILFCNETLAHKDFHVEHRMECTGDFVFKSTYSYGKYVNTAISVQVFDFNGISRPLLCKEYKGSEKLHHTNTGKKDENGCKAKKQKK